MSGQAAGDALILASEGEPRATIAWWSRDESPVPAFAVAELQRYLQAMSGATLRVVRATGEPVGGAASMVALLVGEETGGLAALVGAALEPVAEQVAGLREDGFVAWTVQGDGAIVLAGTSHRGTLYAAYALLEHLGARFFAPAFPFYAGHAERVPHSREVAVPPLRLREEPSFTHRRKYVEEGWSHTAATLPALIDWLAKTRHNVLVYPYDYEGLGVVRWDDWRERLLPEIERRGLVVEVGGHGYQSFLSPDKYGAEHPDWFVVGCNVFDVTNEAALGTYIANVVAYLRARPEIGIFDAWPPDMACWPPRVVERFGSIANAQAYVTRRLSEAVRRELPGVAVEALAYIPDVEPPAREWMYDDATILDIAPYDRSHGEPLESSQHPRNRYYREVIERWRDSGFGGTLAIYEYYRRYAWCSRPVLLPGLIGREMPYYHRLGARGFGIYSEPADRLTYELTHLLVAALSWSVDLTVRAWVQAYLADRYGAASAALGGYVRRCEEAARLLFDRVDGNDANLDVVADARDAYLRAREYLGEAREQAGDEAAAYLIERLGWNLEFTIADIEASYFRLLDGPDAARRAEEAHQRARALVAAHRLDGIILQGAQVTRRFGPGDAGTPREAMGWVYEMYRGAWSVERGA